MKSNVLVKIAAAKQKASRLAQKAKKASARFQAARKATRAAKLRVKLARRSLRAARKSRKQLKRTAGAAQADWRKAARKVSRLEKKAPHAKAVEKPAVKKTLAHRSRARTRRARPKLLISHPASKPKRANAKGPEVFATLHGSHAVTTGTNQGAHYSSSSFEGGHPAEKISASGAENVHGPVHTPAAPAPPATIREDSTLRISEPSSLSRQS